MIQSMMTTKKDGKSGKINCLNCPKLQLTDVLVQLALENWSLLSFADASQVAYGAVCYLRLVDVNDRMHCAFLVGRSPLTHVRPMTVPRLELCAAVLAVQLKQSIREEWDIPLTKSTLWSDSTCVLQYIKKQSRRFHTFVAKGCRLFTNFRPLTSGDMYLLSRTTCTWRCLLYTSPSPRDA